MKRHHFICTAVSIEEKGPKEMGVRKHKSEYHMTLSKNDDFSKQNLNFNLKRVCTLENLPYGFVKGPYTFSIILLRPFSSGLLAADAFGTVQSYYLDFLSHNKNSKIRNFQSFD